MDYPYYNTEGYLLDDLYRLPERAVNRLPRCVKYAFIHSLGQWFPNCVSRDPGVAWSCTGGGRELERSN
jgi:hypothetical protein